MKLVFLYSSVLVFASSLVAEEKKIDLLDLMLHDNASLAVKNAEGMTPLMFAAEMK